MGVWIGRCRWAALVAALAAMWVLAGNGDRAEPASAATTPRGVVFGGLTSQRRPIVIRVSPARTRVNRVDWSWQARCVLGPAAPVGTSLTKSWTDSTAPLRFAISAAGRWASGRYTTGPFTDPTTGVSETFTYKLTGRLVDRGTRMTGTIRATFAESSAAGVIRTCNSGLVTFTILD